MLGHDSEGKVRGGPAYLDECNLFAPRLADFAHGGLGDNYNYYRDYAPEIGRYIESDPIGLAGELNTFGYVRADPIGRADPLGLQSLAACANPANALACAEAGIIPGAGLAAGNAINQSQSGTSSSSSEECSDCDPPVGTQCQTV
jgi:RHS repeat-associated protein